MSEVDYEGLRSIAIDSLSDVAVTTKNSASARAAAARTILELLGDIGRLQADKPSETLSLLEMSNEQLKNEINRLEGKARILGGTDVPPKAQQDQGVMEAPGQVDLDWPF